MSIAKYCFLLTVLVYAVNAATTHQVARNFKVTRPPRSSSSSPSSTTASLLQKREDDKPLPETLNISFEAYEKTFKLKLTRLEGLIHPDAQVTVFTADNEDESTESIEDIDGAPYVATSITANEVELDKVTMGRFHVSADLEVSGAFEWQGALFRLRPRGHPALEGSLDVAQTADDRLIVTRDWMDERKMMNSFGEITLPSNNQTVSYRCGHDSLKFNKKPFYKDVAEEKPEEKTNTIPAIPLPSPRQQGLQALFARQADSTGGGACQGKRKVLYIGVAADSLYLQKFGNSRQRALQNILTDFALVSAIYEKAFNVELGILSIVLMDGDKGPSGKQITWNLPCTPAIDISKRLTEFSRWRPNQSKQVGLFHLVSGCSESQTVGVAWLDQVCQVRSMRGSDGSEVISGTSVSVLIPNQFSVIAHEIGHNFGAIHDCDRTACRQCKGNNCDCCMCGACDCRAQFIMTPESGGLSLKEFSDCTKGDICSKIPVLGKCLQDPGKYKTIKAAVCGNGIVEEGEECDCGGEEECKRDPCCQSGCKLREGAECADGNHSCCKECKIRPKEEGFVCARATPGELCQFDSKCDGVKPECPVISFAPDGASCQTTDGQGAKCASGTCTSRDLQCKALGKRLGIKRACPSTPSTCKLSCETEKGQCAFLNAAFLDGTACGKKGICQGGACSESSVSEFAVENAPIVVIAGALVGALAFILLIKAIVALRRARNS